MLTSFIFGIILLHLSKGLNQQLEEKFVGYSSNESIATLQERSSNEITDALDITSKLGSALKDDLFTDNKLNEGLPAILNAVKFAPYLGVASALLSALIPSQPDPQLVAIKNQLNVIEERIEGLSDKVRGLGNHIALQHSATRLSSVIDTLDGAKKAYKGYINFPKRNWEQTLTNYFKKNDLYESILSAYRQTTDAKLNTEPLPVNLYKTTRGDYKSIFSTFMYLQSLIMDGVKAFTLACRLSNIPSIDCKNQGKSLMKGQTDFENKFKQVLKQCIDNYDANLKGDVEELLRNHRDLKNSKLADEIQTNLQKKYFWRDHSVLVYNPITGSNVHYVRGIFFFRRYDRNTVILTGKRMPDPFAKVQRTPEKVGRLAFNDLFYENYRQCLPRRGCKTLRRNVERSAQWLFDRVEERLKARRYNHGGLAVVKQDSGLGYKLGENAYAANAGWSRTGSRGRIHHHKFTFILELYEKRFK